MKKTSILQCPGIVCSPPVVSKCLGEAHRRLELFTLHYTRLHYITLNPFFFSILLVKIQSLRARIKISTPNFGKRSFSSSSPQKQAQQQHTKKYSMSIGTLVKKKLSHFAEVLNFAQI